MNPAFLRVSSCLAVSLLVAGCDGAKEKSADTTAQFTAAADALSAKLQGGQVPAADDAAVKAFQAEAERGLKVLGTPALPVEGFDSYQAICGKTATIAAAYVNAGVDQAPAAEKAAVMNRNAEQHMDQLFAPLLFSAHCTAAHMPFIQKKAGDDVSSKAAALQQVRAGAFGQAGGLLGMAGADDLDAAQKRRIVQLLAADAPAFATVLSVAQRQELARGADALSAFVPEDLRADVARIKSGFTAAPCESLCKM
jgi:hypothetical protein